jgi:hypothetical protein
MTGRTWLHQSSTRSTNPFRGPLDGCLRTGRLGCTSELSSDSSDVVRRFPSDQHFGQP